MKRWCAFIVLFLFCFSQGAEAQNILAKPKKKSDSSTVVIPTERIEIVRDRLMVDIFHSFWFGVPSQVNDNFNPGFNVSVMWDFHEKKNTPFSFGLGIGMSYHTQFSNALFQYDSIADLMRYNLIPDGIDYKLNRLTYINCHIPLEFRYRANNGLKFTLGLRLGLIAEISQRYKGDNILNIGDEQNFKSFEISNKQKYNFDVFLRFGWKYVSFYYSYQVNSLIEDGKGPKIHPMSLGITISLF